MRKFVITALMVVLFSLSGLAFQRAKTVSVASTMVAEPQTKCERGFINIQFTGEKGWFKTTKKCDMRATPPELDTTHASRVLTRAQLAALMESYLSGNPQPQDQQQCCCQPGYRVWDNSTQNCHNGTIVAK